MPSTKPTIAATPALANRGLEQLRQHFEVHILPPTQRVADMPGVRPETIRGIATSGSKTGCGMLGNSLFDQLPGLEIISSHSSGLDGIDTAAAAKRGIVITHSPHVLVEPVADIALALALDITRGITAGDRYVRAGRWKKDGPMPLSTLTSGKLAGILGLGRIGTAIAERGRGFGMPVVYFHRRRVAPEEEARLASRDAALQAGHSRAARLLQEGQAAAERAVAREAAEREASEAARLGAEHSRKEAERWRAAAAASRAAAGEDAPSLEVLKSALDAAPQYSSIADLSSAHSRLQREASRAEEEAKGAEAGARLVAAEAAAEGAGLEKEIGELRREVERAKEGVASARAALSAARERALARGEAREREARRARALRQAVAALLERAAAVVPPSSLSFAAITRAAAAAAAAEASNSGSDFSSSWSSLAEGVVAVGTWCGDVRAAAAGK